jgi:hypothetical protein
MFWISPLIIKNLFSCIISFNMLICKYCIYSFINIVKYFLCQEKSEEYSWPITGKINNFMMIFVSFQTMRRTAIKNNKISKKEA